VTTSSSVIDQGVLSPLWRQVQFLGNNTIALMNYASFRNWTHAIFDPFVCLIAFSRLVDFSALA
jgi:hypothetical protein